MKRSAAPPPPAAPPLPFPAPMPATRPHRTPPSDRPDRMPLCAALGLVALLVACQSTPSFDMLKATRIPVTVDGRAFTVFARATTVEVVREGFASPTGRKETVSRMLMAVRQATGCKPVADSFTGDAVLQRGTIDCN